jgi:hypothetical protein
MLVVTNPPSRPPPQRTPMSDTTEPPMDALAGVVVPPVAMAPVSWVCLQLHLPAGWGRPGGVSTVVV